MGGGMRSEIAGPAGTGLPKANKGVTLSACEIYLGPHQGGRERKKHGVTFEEAATVFSNPLARIFPDSLHADRGLMLGHAEGGGLLVVVFSEVTEDVIRIISARPATSRERKHYEGDA